jgi:segregation and condensation protein B
MDDKNTEKPAPFAGKQAELEALLFYYGEAMPIKKIAKILDIKESECGALIETFRSRLDSSPESALTILSNEKEVQLVTKNDFQSIGQKLVEEEFKEELTPAGLETLSIIAYLGPISRATIDYIRGVNSSFTIRNLLMRGLITREVNAEKSNVYDYRVSFDFMKHLGINRQEDLPEYEKFRDVLKRFELGQSNPPVENKEAIEQT